MNIFNLVLKDLKLFLKSKSAVLMTYIVPMILALIFGAIFGGMGSDSGINEIKILLVDNDKTDFSAKFHTILDSLPEIIVHTKYYSGDTTITFTKEKMDEWIKHGKRSMGLFIPKGFEKKMLKSEKIPLEIHYDPKFQIEYGIINGLIQKTIMSKFPEIILNSMWKSSEEYLGKKKNEELKKSIYTQIQKYFPNYSEEKNYIPSNKVDKPYINFTNTPLEIKEIKLLGQEEENIMFAQYVAGMAVMFLLFSVTQAGSSLLEEKNNGTIRRLLVAPVTKGHILTGKLIYITIIGLSQLIVLFIFGWLVFGLNIFKDIPALLVMIIVTSLACSALGIFIAAICKNINQVNSLSVLIILSMSALGGSMMPSFIMPKYIQAIGHFTLNFWAMKGFTDIFWRNMHLQNIFPSIGVLIGICLVFTYFSIRIFNKRLLD